MTAAHRWTYLLLIALLCACSEHKANDLATRNMSPRETLSRAEELMQTRPDSALMLLKDLSKGALRGRENRAHFALLYSQALDKNYIDLANDSIIRVATDYYQYRGSELHRMQAFYYHGLVYQRKGFFHEALLYYTRALDFLPKVNDPYSIALLMAQLGVIYGNFYDYPQALSYMDKALHYYTLAGKERLQNITKRNLGKTYLNLNESSQAKTLLREALEWGEAHNDTYVVYSTLCLLFRLYDSLGDYDSISSLLQSYPLDSLRHFTDIYAIVARHHAMNHDISLATQTLSQAWNMSATVNDTMMLYQKSFQVYQALGMIDKALDNHISLLAMQDSIVRITLQQPLMAAQRDYYHSELNLAKVRNINYLYMLGFLALAIIIVVMAAWWAYREMYRKKELQINKYIDIADQLRNTLYHKEEELTIATEALHQKSLDTATLQQRIASLFKEQYILLDELCTTYYENPKEELRRGYIFKQVLSTINSFSSDEGYVKLESIVNDGCNDAIAHLRREFPKFKEKDFRLLCYFCAGFSIQTICLFTQKDAKKLWVYKSRLITRIKNSDAPSKDIILAQIPQRIR